MINRASLKKLLRFSISRTFLWRTSSMVVSWTTTKMTFWLTSLSFLGNFITKSQSFWKWSLSFVYFIMSFFCLQKPLMLWKQRMQWDFSIMAEYELEKKLAFYPSFWYALDPFCMWQLNAMFLPLIPILKKTSCHSFLVHNGYCICSKLHLKKRSAGVHNLFEC